MPSTHTPKRGRNFYGPGPYIERDCDEALRTALLAGEYALVLGPRGIGKTSLRIRVAEELADEDIRAAVVDLGAIGAETRADAFCASLLIEAGRSLGLAEAAKKAWRRSKGPPQMRLRACIREVLLEPDETPLILFIDELELVRTLGPARDDFFAALRAMADARGHDPIWRRLSVCMIGVITRDELISDPRRNTFDLPVREIAPRDFSREQLDEFTGVLAPLGGDASKLLDALYDWTNGHPALCQWLAGDLLLRELGEGKGAEATAVEAVVRETFLQRGPEVDPLLGDTARRLRRDQRDPWRTRVLAAYERVLRGEAIDLRGRQLGSEGALIVARLKVAGLVGASPGGRLRVRNKVVERAFDRNWVRRALAGRPISEALERWESSGRRPGQLLRGEALSSAIEWLEGRPDVTPAERDFVIASERFRTTRTRRALWAGVALSLGLGALLAGSLWQYREVLYEPMQTTVDGASADADAQAEADEQAERKAEAVADLAQAAADAERKTFVAQTREAVEEASGFDALEGEIADLHNELEAASQRLALEQAERAVLLAEIPERRAEGLSLALAALDPWAEAIADAPPPVLRALTASLRSPDDTRIIEAHGGPIEQLADSGERLVSVATILSGDLEQPAAARTTTQIRVWDRSGRRVASLDSPAGRLALVALSPDGSQLAALSEAGSLVTWDLDEGSAHGPAPIPPPEDSEGPLAPIARLMIDDQGGVRLLRSDASVNLYVPGSGRPPSLAIPTRLPAELPLEHAAVSDRSNEGGPRVVLQDGELLELWDPEAGRAVASVPAPSFAAGLRELAIAPDNTRVIALANGATSVTVWELASGELRTVAAGDRPLTALALAPHGELLATGDRSGQLRLWSLADGELLAKLDAHAVEITQLHFFARPGGELGLISGDQGGVLRLQALPTGDRPPARYARVGPQGQALLASTHEGKLWLEQSAGFGTLAPLALAAPVERVVASLDGEQLGLIFADGRAGLFERRVGETLGPETAMRSLDARILDLAVSDDGELFVSAGEDRKLALWNGEGEPVANLAGHEAPVDRLALAPDGARLLSADRSGVLRLWDPRTAALLATFETELAPRELEIAGSTAAVIAELGRAELWSLDTRERIAELELGPEPVAAPALADALPGWSGPILALARPSLGVVELWSVETGEPVARFRTGGSVVGLGFVADPEHEGAIDLLVVDAKGDLSHWPTAPGRWLDQACIALPPGTVLPRVCPLDE